MLDLNWNKRFRVKKQSIAAEVLMKLIQSYFFIYKSSELNDVIYVKSLTGYSAILNIGNDDKN